MPKSAAVGTLSAALLLAAPGAALAKTLTVSPQGSDSASGSSSTPLRTIAKASALAVTGDTVEVKSGRYQESISLTSRQKGVIFRGVGATRPVIDGAGFRTYGFKSVGADGLTIENFELRGQTRAGIYTQGSRATISGNLIHHVGATAETNSNGVRVVQGAGNKVIRNVIHHIGPGSESMGIWLVQTKDATVHGNSVYLVRKEGVRDWKGLDNTITDNRFFLNWVGVSLNTATGSTVTNNYVYDNVEGITTKHASYKTVLSYWGLAAGHWSRVWHNTVYRSTETSVWIGQSDEPLDMLDIRDNVFAAAGTAFLRDRPDLRGPQVVVDGNAYVDAGQKPSYIYRVGWSSSPGLSDWADVRSATSWEAAGGPASLSLRDPAIGDLELTDLSTAGLPLGDARDTQLGARGLPPAPATWAPYTMTAIDSSSKGSWSTKYLQRSADNNQATYWQTNTAANEYAVYDFGGRRTFNHLVLSIFAHLDKRNPRGYRFEVSDDAQNWRTVKQGVNPDSAGSAYAYELQKPETARYLRFTMVDTFCSSYAPRTDCGASFVMSDLKVGLVAG